MKKINFLLLLTMVFFLFGCGTEDDITQKHPNKEDFSNKAEISHSTLEKEKNVMSLLEEFKGKNKQFKASLSDFEVAGSVTIVKLNDVTSYNMLLKPSAEDKKGSIVKNLTIIERKDRKEYKMTTYIPKDGKPFSSLVDFQGEILYQNLETGKTKLDRTSFATKPKQNKVSKEEGSIATSTFNFGCYTYNYFYIGGVYEVWELGSMYYTCGTNEEGEEEEEIPPFPDLDIPQHSSALKYGSFLSRRTPTERAFLANHPAVNQQIYDFLYSYDFFNSVPAYVISIGMVEFLAKNNNPNFLQEFESLDRGKKFMNFGVQLYNQNPFVWTDFEKWFLTDIPDGFLQQVILENPATILNYETLSSPNFKMRRLDQLKYPNFTTIVKNIKTEIQNNPTTLNTLVDLTGLTEAKVIENLTFGQGPTIKFVPNLMGPSGPNYGNFNPAYPTYINIKLEFVLGLEQSVLSSTRHATAFLLAVTVLHEFIHFGNYLSGYDTNGNEMGQLFEYSTYGMIITHFNAGSYLIQLK